MGREFKVRPVQQIRIRYDEVTYKTCLRHRYPVEHLEVPEPGDKRKVSVFTFSEVNNTFGADAGGDDVERRYATLLSMDVFGGTGWTRGDAWKRASESFLKHRPMYAASYQVAMSKVVYRLWIENTKPKGTITFDVIEDRYARIAQ